MSEKIKPTPELLGKIADLQRCTFLPGSYDKRFVRAMSYVTEQSEITEKQAVFIEKLHHRYRRQISYFRDAERSLHANH